MLPLPQHKGATLQAPTKAPQAAAATATILYLEYVSTANGSSAFSAPADFNACQPTSASTA